MTGKGYLVIAKIDARYIFKKNSLYKAKRKATKEIVLAISKISFDASS